MIPGLDSELDKLQVLLERLAEEYKAKSISVENTLGPNDTGQLRLLKLSVKLRNSSLQWTMLYYIGNPSKNNLFFELAKNTNVALEQ